MTMGEVPLQEQQRRFPFSWTRRLPESDNNEEHFDSSRFRCCCNIFHAKIGAFLITTLLLHEIVFGVVYITQRPDWSDYTSHLSILSCRCFQMIPIPFAYAGLWQRKHYFLIPFVVSQLTFGAYADMCTWMLLVRDADASVQVPYFFTSPLFYVVLPILMYATYCIFFAYAMYKCYSYFKARNSYRNVHEYQQTQLESLM